MNNFRAHQKVILGYGTPLEEHFCDLLHNIRTLDAVLPIHDIIFA